jgi:acetoin utilization deacetylase AcuC-like enzyme
LKVFYPPKMLGPPQARSPSAHKPQPVVESWLTIAPQLEIIAPEPVSVTQLCLAHSPEHVADVLAGRAPNGFGNQSLEVAASLPYTSGSMLSAARAAMADGTVAVAPCAGFHHAMYAFAADFCTFNGLIVTARALLQEGVATRVGILDADMHYGDGTDEILAAVGETRVVHCRLGEHYWEPGDAEGFFDQLPTILAGFVDCDLLLYQAGADPHVDDPLGGWLTTEQLRGRDRSVFEFCATHRLPIAWNLAGGYQQPLRRVLDIHDNTLRECLRVYEPNTVVENPTHQSS